jgi:hypothetical protein
MPRCKSKGYEYKWISIKSDTFKKDKKYLVKKLKSMIQDVPVYEKGKYKGYVGFGGIFLAKLKKTKYRGEVNGYYFDGQKSYTIYHKENRSYMLQDK